MIDARGARNCANKKAFDNTTYNDEKAHTDWRQYYVIKRTECHTIQEGFATKDPKVKYVL